MGVFFIYSLWKNKNEMRVKLNKILNEDIDCRKYSIPIAKSYMGFELKLKVSAINLTLTIENDEIIRYVNYIPDNLPKRKLNLRKPELITVKKIENLNPTEKHFEDIMKGMQNHKAMYRP